MGDSKEMGTDGGMVTLWDGDASKYKCCCRSVHVRTATLYIGYAQLFVTMVFMAVFFYYCYHVQYQGVDADSWIAHYGRNYIMSMMLAVVVQLFIVSFLIHGAKTERRAYLLPFLVVAMMGIFFGFVQLISDFVALVRQAQGHQVFSSSADNQLLTHMVGTLVHLWCVGVVWRCYTYFSDKKIAVKFNDQITATHVAFHFADAPQGYMAMPEPPPYADTVISDKQPLTASA